jgi:hypothetical protein
MKFNKPINREVEIDRNNFVVTMDESGVTFRVKGKRKSLRAEWPAILYIARAEGTEAEHHESGHHLASHKDETEEPAHGIGRTASAGDRPSES